MLPLIGAAFGIGLAFSSMVFSWSFLMPHKRKEDKDTKRA